MMAALQEATKNNWTMAIAIVDTGGKLVMFKKMDNTQIGSVDVAISKATTANNFKRASKVFEDGVAAGGLGLRILITSRVTPLEGGELIIFNGKNHWCYRSIGRTIHSRWPGGKSRNCRDRLISDINLFQTSIFNHEKVSHSNFSLCCHLLFRSTNTDSLWGSYRWKKQRAAAASNNCSEGNRSLRLTKDLPNPVRMTGPHRLEQENRLCPASSICTSIWKVRPAKILR